MVIANCNVNLMSDSGTIRSPNFPKKYDQGECHYNIVVPHGKAITINWKSFQVGTAKKNDKCLSDSVWVYDGTLKTYTGIFTLCGQVKQSITSSANKLTIVLKSNTQGLYTGFLATYNTSKRKLTAIQQMMLFLNNCKQI